MDLNVKELRAELLRRGIRARDAASRLGISPSTLYRKMNGRSEFFRSEIAEMGRLLEMSDERLLAVFFDR